VKIFASIAVVAILAVLAWIAFNAAGPPDFANQDFANKDYRWHAELDSPGGNLLVRGAKLDSIRSDLGKLVSAVNGSQDDPETFRTPSGREPTGSPKLKLVGVTAGVATVEVINAEHLTQRMGSTGADIFMAEATFTLTENRAVESVEFRFEEGDHAVPGMYSRKDFLGRWKPVE
jgi:hypothetical protein